jgi:hypothetical protein
MMGTSNNYPPNASASTSPENYDEGEITELSVKAIELYQIQGQLIDRIWAYLSQYSAMLILIGFIAVAFRGTAVVANMPTLAASVPALTYILFCFGNHRSLSLSMDELLILRNVANLQTRLQFRGSSKGTILRFHLLLMAISAGIYAGCWFYAKQAASS